MGRHTQQPRKKERKKARINTICIYKASELLDMGKNIWHVMSEIDDDFFDYLYRSALLWLLYTLALLLLHWKCILCSPAQRVAATASFVSVAYFSQIR